MNKLEPRRTPAVCAAGGAMPGSGHSFIARNNQRRSPYRLLCAEKRACFRRFFDVTCDRMGPGVIHLPLVPLTGRSDHFLNGLTAWSAQRKRTERALEQARDSLEMTVEQRTAQLRNANATLKVEVAERQATEEELRHNETLLAHGQKMSRTASWTLQPANGEMRWSAELFDMFGLDPAATPPSFRLFKDRVHPDDRPRFDAALALAIEGSTNFS